MLFLNRPQDILDTVFRNLMTEFGCMDIRGAIMNAAPDARVHHLFAHLRQALVRARAFNRRVGQADVDLVAEEFLQHPLRCTTVNSVPGRIFRVGRRGQKRLPVRIGGKRRVACTVGVADRCYWPPEVVPVLGFPACDVRIRAGHVEQGEHPRIFNHAEALLCADSCRAVSLSATTPEMVQNLAASV